MAYTNSPLVNYTKLSPNNSGERTHTIDRITPHCVVGQCSVEVLGNIFYNPSRQASSNYGIGTDGRVGMYVEEKNRSWCSSSSENDQRAITIECASDAKPPYAFNNVVYNKLIDLCADICKRNGKKKLLWLGSHAKALAYKPKADEMVLTAHRWFAATACPGEWLYSREADLAQRVTDKLNPAPKPIGKISVKYQTHDYAKNKWLPNVTDNFDYAGNFGNAVDGLKANLTKGNIWYKVHIKATKTYKGRWLPEVKNRTDFAGNIGQPIDAVMIRSDVGTVKYQVHIAGGKWLPEVSGYNEKDTKNGYAGNIGQFIDAIKIHIV